MKKRVGKWLLGQEEYLYGGFAGALLGGAVERLISVLAGMWTNSYFTTVFDLLGSLVICVSGLFLLRIAGDVELIDRLVHSYIESRARKGEIIDPNELRKYEEEKQEEHGGQVLSKFAYFLVCFAIGIFLTILGHLPLWPLVEAVP